MVTTIDRKRGTLLGLAVGDALGAAVEFQRPGTFAPVTGYRGGGPHGIAAGQWTDDTSLALALADSLARVGWDPNDQARRYLAWWREGAYAVAGRSFSMGITTGNALRRFEQTGDAFRSGHPTDDPSSNGSIMRLAPISIRYANRFPGRLDELVSYSVGSSRPTHASPPCLSACAYLGLVLAALINGVDRDEVLAPKWPPLVWLAHHYSLSPEVVEVAEGSYRQKQPPAIVGSGDVIRSLEAALWAFHGAGDFRQSVLRAVNLGDDADTTGAVCGQLAGACWGESGIPSEWLTGLARRDLIESALRGIIRDD